MKKIIGILSASLAIYFNGWSQCTPNVPTGNAGLSPAPSAVPCIERGVFYDFTLNFENFTGFSCSGFTADVISGTINSLSNLPCGITWQANKTIFTAGETGCIRISGTTTDVVGQYPLTVNMTFELDIFGSSYTVSGTLQDLIQQMQNVGCTPPSINIDYYSRVIEPGTTCPAIGGMSNRTSSGTTCPPPSVTISGNTNICTGSSTTLMANVTNSAGTVTYSWSSGAGSTQSISISPASTTTYTVTVSAGNGSATASSTVTVTQGPSAAFTATPSGADVTINNATTGSTSYSWDFGDGQTSAAQNPPAHTYSSNGTYIITLIATSSSCGNDTATQPVTITGAGGLSVTISGNTTICAGALTTLTANVSDAIGSVSYAWSPGGGSAQTITVNPASTTTYSLTVTAQNGVAAASATITVNQPPNASFTVSNTDATVTITNATTGAASYSWDFGDGQTSTAQNPPAHTYSANGTFTITLIATNGCADTVTQNVAILGVGISSGNAANPLALRIYPNPFNSTATVEVQEMKGSFDFALYSINGLKVYERIGVSENKFLIKKEALPQGVYFIEVRNEKMLAKDKMVIY